MQQFYKVFVSSADDPVVVHFEKPVRKLQINALINYAACSIGKTMQQDEAFVFGSSGPITLDFQSANTGKGVEDITFWRFTGTGAMTISLSVVEYGSDGDNAFFLSEVYTNE